MRGRRGAPVLALVLLALTPAAPSAAESAPACALPETWDAAALTAAQDCVIGLERAHGPEWPGLRADLAPLGDHFAGRPETAAGALFFRRRALRLEQALEGPESVAAAEAALSTARAWILSGRCHAQDARVTPLLDAAAIGFGKAETPIRGPGLAAVAAAYADLTAYGLAAATLVAAGPADAAAWERVGDWRRRAGDPIGAAEAWERALDASLGTDRRAAARRARLTDGLRRVFFERGDSAGLRRLEATLAR